MALLLSSRGAVSCILCLALPGLLPSHKHHSFPHGRRCPTAVCHHRRRQARPARGHGRRRAGLRLGLLFDPHLAAIADERVARRRLGFGHSNRGFCMPPATVLQLLTTRNRFSTRLSQPSSFTSSVWVWEPRWTASPRRSLNSWERCVPLLSMCDACGVPAHSRSAQGRRLHPVRGCTQPSHIRNHV